MSSSSQDSMIIFTGNEPEGCASFIRAVIRHAFQLGKQYDRRWMAYFASTCLVSDASRWYTTLDPQQRVEWKAFCHALLQRYPVVDVASDVRQSPSRIDFPSHPTSPRPPLGTKYSNSAPKTPPPIPSSRGLIRLDFLDGSIPSRYISSQLRHGYSTVYKADLDGVDDASRSLALHVCFDYHARGGLKVYTSDDQTTCLAIDKKSPDFSYLALVPHAPATHAWAAQPHSSQTVQADVWSVRADGLMQVGWHQHPPSQPTSNESSAPGSRVLQRTGQLVPLGVVCHLKSGSIEIMRNAEQYCARYPGWFEVMMVFEPFVRPEWMLPLPSDRESAMSPLSGGSRRDSLSGRLGSQKLRKRRLSKRIGSVVVM